MKVFCNCFRIVRHRRSSLICTFSFLTLLVFLWTNKPEVSESSHFVHPFSTGHYNGSHSLAVVVPFRDRSDELHIFVPHISKFLDIQQIPFKIFVLNQTDKFRFNRAALINIGFVLSNAENFDYMAMHDVDLLPLDARLSYAFPAAGVMHLSSPHLHPLYHYKTFVGGILLIKHADFQNINGMSNKYWGWGLEDDEFYTRLRRENLTLLRPDFNSSNAFKHIHDRSKRKRDFRQKIPELHKVDRVTGVSTLLKDGEKGSLYSVIKSQTIVIEKYPATIYDVELHCKVSATPWCLPANTSSVSKIVKN